MKSLDLVFTSIADELTEHPDHWTQGTYAKTALEADCDYTSPAAVCWCALGFLKRDLWVSLKVENTEGRALYLKALDILGQLVESSESSLPMWNDTEGRTVDEVIQLFRDAAKRAA